MIALNTIRLASAFLVSVVILACSGNGSSGGSPGGAGGASGASGASGSGGAGGSAGVAGGAAGSGGGAKETECADFAGISRADACAKYANAWCEAEDRCFGTNPFGSGDACITGAAAECSSYFEEWPNGITPAAWAAFAQKLETAECKQVVFGDLSVLHTQGWVNHQALKDAACFVTAQGSLPNGSPCWDPGVCASGICSSTPFECGTCTNAAQVGEDCAASFIPCADSLFCKATGAGLVCAPEVPEGGTCEGTNECAQDLTCRDDVCQPRAKTGEACVVDDDCGGWDKCPAGVCHPVALAAVGQPCEYGDYACTPAALCDYASGTCVAKSFSADGASCLFTDECASGLACVSHVCKPRAPLGAACEYDDCIPPATCLSNTCQLLGCEGACC